MPDGSSPARLIFPSFPPLSLPLPPRKRAQPNSEHRHKSEQQKGRQAAASPFRAPGFLWLPPPS